MILRRDHKIIPRRAYIFSSCSNSELILKGLDSQINGFLFFAGSLLRWPPQNPKQFLYFHIYILLIYFLFWTTGLGLLLVIGALGPLCLAISKGLNVDCLSYEAAISREFPEKIQS